MLVLLGTLLDLDARRHHSVREVTQHHAAANLRLYLSSLSLLRALTVFIFVLRWMKRGVVAQCLAVFSFIGKISGR